MVTLSSVIPMPTPPLLVRRAVWAALAAVVCAGAAPGQSSAGEALRLEHGWTRPGATGANGAGYLTITNRGNAADTLIAATTPYATRTSIHQSAMVGQVMTMRTLRTLPIPPGAAVNLRPGGLHLMFERLNRPLKIGEEVPAVLTFARAGRVRVRFHVVVGPAGGAMPGM